MQRERENKNLSLSPLLMRWRGNSSRDFLAFAIIVYFVVLALSYAGALPLMEATDEAAHFLYIHNFLESGALPVMTSRLDITGSASAVERWSLERHQPPLYYMVGALLVSWTQRNDIEAYLQPNALIFMRRITDDNANMWLHRPGYPGDTAAAFWTLRLYSLALASGTLWFVYKAGELAFSRRVGLLALLLTASIPTFISIGASVNNDNMVTLFYSAGIYWCLRMWRRRAITRLDILAVSLILSGAALSKLTGLTLFGVVYLSLFTGGCKQLYSWRRAALLVGVSLAAAALLAGWWYARNLHLYGDPLASAKTIEMLGRDFTTAAESGDLMAEAARIWKTFWLGIGHLHALVYGPAWLYSYMLVTAAAGLGGLGALWWQYRRFLLRRDSDVRTRQGRVATRNPADQGLFFHQDTGAITLLFLLFVCLVVVVSLIVGTRDIDISYGRIAFPALAAFAPLLVAGWGTIPGLFLRHRRYPAYTGLLIMPLAVIALVTPVKYLPDAYPPLTAVEAVPASAQPVNTRAESLTLLAYELRSPIAAPGGEIRLWLYIQNPHPDNPALVVTALDPVTGLSLGSASRYPAMTPLADLEPGLIYRVPVILRLDEAAARGLSPRRVDLLLNWEVPFPPRTLDWFDADGQPVSAPVIPGPLLIDPAHKPPVPQVQTDVSYGDQIRLTGYSLSPVSGEIAPGGSLTVTLQWDASGPIKANWTLALGLLDGSRIPIAQADGMPLGYPTSLWQPGVAFDDVRTLAIPPDTPPGDYRLYAGWYRLDSGERLTPHGAGVEDSLFIAPTAVRVIEP